MNRDRETFQTIGKALFGPSWQYALAEALSVTPKTVYRWTKGDSDIPAAIWAELATLCRSRGYELFGLADALLAGEPRQGQ